VLRRYRRIWGQEALPSLPKEGWPRHQKWSRSEVADGVVAHKPSFRGHGKTLT
jgi:hypothetical protein